MRERRYGLFSALWELLRTPAPPGYRGYLAFGWLILLLFAVQVVTGILLSFYYQPSPEMASKSVEYIMRDVDSGWLVRGMHHWAAQGMIALGFVQLLKVILTGAYRGARSASWYLGLLLLLLVIAFAASGALLAWDNRAYWAADSALGRVEALPFLGPTLATTLRGGSEVGAGTLSRAYSGHVLLLPWLTVTLVVVNLWLLARRRPLVEES